MRFPLDRGVVGDIEVTSVLITGANAGIGRELARQIGAREEISRVYLGCRNRERGLAALDRLEDEVGRSVFDLVIADVADVRSARRAVASLSEPVDELASVIDGSYYEGRRFSGTAAYAQVKWFTSPVDGCRRVRPAGSARGSRSRRGSR